MAAALPGGLAPFQEVNRPIHVSRACLWHLPEQNGRALRVNVAWLLFLDGSILIEVPGAEGLQTLQSSQVSWSVTPHLCRGGV